ncbi:hypothetical protein [Marinoscillum sp.]|uniref:hypothetical protein n=1 Tax=Marinoscillum sp. TaxID=2024838 RepID=UPI003BAD91E3
MTLREKLTAHINYRDVFNAPTRKDLLKRWSVDAGVNEGAFEQCIDDLKAEKLITEKNGYLAIFAKEEIIDLQTEKSQQALQILRKARRGLQWISKLPFVRFIGISGSVAADNPTAVQQSDHVDLDLYIVTSRHTLWLFTLLERLITNVIRLVKGDHFFCMNYSTEIDFVEVYNQSFYTATELVNLIPVYDHGGIYNRIINENLWYRNYYASESILSTRNIETIRSSFTWVVSPVNFLCYVFFCLLRSAKRLDMEGLRGFSLSFDPTQRYNLKRVSTPHGGYEPLIRMRFEKLLKVNFPGVDAVSLSEVLFPDSDGKSDPKMKVLRDEGCEELFVKYSLNEKTGTV